MPPIPPLIVFRRGPWVTACTALYAAACVAADLFPRHAPAMFNYRSWMNYTRAMALFPVWNFGWPRALFIYDPRYGGRLYTLYGTPRVIAVQFLVLAAGVAVALAGHWVQARQRVRRGFPVVA